MEHDQFVDGRGKDNYFRVSRVRAGYERTLILLPVFIDKKLMP
jgi:hypothetical protein